MGYKTKIAFPPDAFIATSVQSDLRKSDQNYMSGAVPKVRI